MALALSPELSKGVLSHLIVADIAPIRGSLSHEFTNYVNGMLKIETENLAKSKKEAFQLLEDCEKVGLHCHLQWCPRMVDTQDCIISRMN